MGGDDGEGSCVGADDKDMTIMQTTTTTTEASMTTMGGYDDAGYGKGFLWRRW